MIELDLSELQRWGGLLGSEAEAIARRVEPAVAAQQAATLAAVRDAAPVRTGAVRSSVRPTGKGMNRWVRAGNKKAFYARYLEFGTSKMAARPFVRPHADDQAHTEFEDRIDDALAAGPIFS